MPAGIQFYVSNPRGATRTLAHPDAFNTTFARVSFPVGSLTSIAGRTPGPDDSVLVTIQPQAGVYGLMVRIMRTSVLDSLGEEYVRTAEAKGLSRWRVLRRHVLRNAMLPAVTVLGLEFGLLAAGVFVVESVFQWPGLGNYAFQAIQANDYNATMGATLVIAVLYVVINLIVDIVYLYLDPRIRYA